MPKEARSSPAGTVTTGREEAGGGRELPSRFTEFLESGLSCRSPLESRINFLPPSVNCSLNRGLLRGECVGQVEFSFHDPIRIMFLDGQLRCESPILQFARSCHDNVALVAFPPLHAETSCSIIALRRSKDSERRPQNSVHHRLAAAPLVLLPGAAGANFIPPDLGSGGNQASSVLIVDALPTTHPPTSDSSRNTSA